MKTLIVCALCLTTVSLPGAFPPPLVQEAADAQAPFTLQITGNLVPEHTQYWDFANPGPITKTTKSIVVIAVQKTNISGREIPKISKWGNYYVGCEYDIRDSSGRPVKELPPRTAGSGFLNGHDVREPEPVLRPGESDVSPEALAERYDLSHPGTYTIQAWARAWDDPHAPIVKSNTLTLIIESASAPPPQ